MLPNNMAFHTEKDLKSKNVTGKKNILTKDVNTEGKFEIKTKKNRPEKGLFFGAPLFRQLKSNCLDCFKKCSSYNKIFTL